MGQRRHALDSCTAGDLSWTDSSSRSAKCTGNWKFDQPCYASDSKPICGTHPVPATCPNYAFGYTPGQLVSAGSSPRITPSGSRRVCGCPDNGPSQPATDTNIPACPGGGPPVCETVYSYDTSCNALAEQSKNQVDGRVPRNLIAVQSSSDVGGGGVIQCSNTLTYPGPATGTNGDICGYNQVNNTCRHPANGLAPNQAECGPISTRYSSRGLSRDGLVNEVNPGYPVNPPNAACLSCDELPANTPSEVATKYACLSGTLNSLPSLPAGVDTVTLRSDVVKKTKLLLELKGDLMDAFDFQTAASLYRTDRPLVYQCSAAASDPVASGACVPTNVSVANAELDMCRRMLAPHVPPLVAQKMLELCTQTAQNLVPAAATCPHVVAANDTWKAVFKKQLDAVQKSGTPQLPSFEEIQQQLVRLDAWYGNQRDYIDTGTAPDSQLWMNTSKMLQVFWSQLYADVLLSDDGSRYLPQAERGLAEGMNVDKAVALATLTPWWDSELPARYALVPFLLSDIFHALGERLEDFSTFHDLACAARGCDGNVSTEVTEMWKLLAALPDEAQLTAALNNTPKLDSAPLERRAWKEVFIRLAQQHFHFRNAVTTAVGAMQYTPSLLSQAELTRLPPPMVGLARLIQKAQSATASYAKSGLLGAQPQRVLRTGIQEAKRTELDARIDNRKNELRAAVERYTSNRSQYVNALVAQVGNVANQSNVQTQLGLKLKQIVDVSSDITGIRLNIAQETQALADAARVLDNALTRELENPSVLGIARTRKVLNVSGASARFVSGAPSVSEMAVLDANTQTPLKVSGNKGDVLTVNVSGQWAPACALRQARLGIPGDAAGGTTPIGVSDGLTGPEGYLVNFQNSAFTAKANRTDVYSNNAQSYNVCAEVRSGGSIGPFSAYVTAQGCVEGDQGKRTSDTQDTGAEGRVSTAFATGLRLVNTPFPRAPVGSLLLVSVDPAQPGAPRSAIRDVQVVTRNSVVVLTQPSDVYFVVNDAALAGCTFDTSNALGVEVNHMVSTGTSAKAMFEAWSDTQKYYQQVTETALAQSRMTGQEMVALRAWAYAKLSERCQGCALSSFPEEFRNLFDLFVSKALAQVERKVEHRLLERARESLLGEVKGLRDDAAFAGLQGRLLTLQPLWSLRNLDAENLRFDARNLSELMQDYLLPVLDIRYPTAVTQLRNETAAVAEHPVNKLLFADWTQPYVDSARLGLGAVDAVVGKLGAVRLNDPNPAYEVVAVSFPRPPGGGRPVGPPSVWKQAGADRAARLWAALESTGKFGLTLTPDDVYVAIGGSAGALQCIDATPVVHSMAFYFARGGSEQISDELNQQRISSGMAFAPTFEFTQEGGIKRYFMNNPNWLVAAPRVLFGPSSKALGKFQDFEIGLPLANQKLAADGLSPFFTAQVDVSGLTQRTPSPLNEATELVVVMQIDRRTVSGMTQPAVCTR
jgi:hypothetical protein